MSYKLSHSFLINKKDTTKPYKSFFYKICFQLTNISLKKFILYVICDFYIWMNKEIIILLSFVNVNLKNNVNRDDNIIVGMRSTQLNIILLFIARSMNIFKYIILV